MNRTRRWLFGDQLGPHFLDAPDQPVLLIESRAVFRRRRFHRQKAARVVGWQTVSGSPTGAAT